MKIIDRDALQEALAAKKPPVLLEALPEKYYADKHLPGARRIDYKETRDQAPQLVPDKSAPVVVYCASETCRNSHSAAEQLVAMGYEDVAVYAGGKADWEAAGLAFE